MTDRFKDSGEVIYDFTDKFLVRCPNCQKCAQITTTPRNGSYFVYEKRKFVCEHCGRIEENTIMNGIGSKNHPLWLEINCCGEKLWAYNVDHLNAIENFVSASLREDYRQGQGWKNQSLVSRLPKWIKDSHNRESILKCIKKLKQTL